MTKKTTITVLLFTTVLLACTAGDKADTAAAKASEAGANADASYAIGMLMSGQIKSTGIVLDYDEFLKGVKDTMENQERRLDEAEAQSIVQTAFKEAQIRMVEENRQKEEQFFAENKQKSGITTTPSGLQYEIITKGTGSTPATTDVVRVHYEGSLLDGTVFDSSYTRGEPAEFPLDAVIPGWTEGLTLMPVGSTYTLYIPSNLGYGEQGAGGVIPPNSTLIFKVELLSIETPE
ncbi:MAG: FKBP-type peptidyl-prolyl cis-trans isomerase [Treponema sp.]|nr:FKBP-type peptidyl-prolyl cis-trans isomerase [Treponema sp.]